MSTSKRSKTVSLLLPLTAPLVACSNEPTVTTVPMKHATTRCDSAYTADIERCKGTTVQSGGGGAHSSYIYVPGYHGSSGYVAPQSFGAVPSKPATATFVPTPSYRGGIASGATARGGFGGFSGGFSSGG